MAFGIYVVVAESFAVIVVFPLFTGRDINFVTEMFETAQCAKLYGRESPDLTCCPGKVRKIII